jgi:hypothetical protein
MIQTNDSKKNKLRAWGGADYVTFFLDTGIQRYFHAGAMATLLLPRRSRQDFAYRENIKYTLLCYLFN